MKNTQHTREQQDLLNTQSATDTKDKESSPLLTREPIKKTPFWIIGNDELGYKITWGKYSFNDEPLKKEEVKKWWDDNQWKIILHLIAIGYQVTRDAEKKDTNSL